MIQEADLIIEEVTEFAREDHILIGGYGRVAGVIMGEDEDIGAVKDEEAFKLIHVESDTVGDTCGQYGRGGKSACFVDAECA